MVGARNVLWFRKDLRIMDNPVLQLAAESSTDLLCVYCIDPRYYDVNSWSRPGPTHSKIVIEAPAGMEPIRKTGPFRARFVIECVLDLQSKLRESGSDLLILKGKPEEMIPQLVKGLDPRPASVFATGAETFDERNIEARLRQSLGDIKQQGFDGDWRACQLELVRWANTLHHPEDFSPAVTVQSLPQPFTNYRNKVQNTTPVRQPKPCPKLPGTVPLDVLPAAVQESVVPAEVSAMEDAVGLAPGTPKHDPRGVMRFHGGETAAVARIESYCRKGLSTYKQTRDGLIGESYSTKFSPWLAFGCLSPRTIYWRIKNYEEQNEGETTNTRLVIVELMWRDWFYFLCSKHGPSIFFPGGPAGLEPSWPGTWDDFDRWRIGETGVPFVDANMKELKLTGWMSNRGRQNVASYLIHDLGVDWRWGAMHFEECLLDHDVCSNYGNWIHAAGCVDQDQQINRFNVESEASLYDADNQFIKLWLSETLKNPEAAVQEEKWEEKKNMQEAA